VPSAGAFPWRVSVAGTRQKKKGTKMFDIGTDTCYKSSMPKNKPKPTITEVLQAAIENSGLTRYRIAVDTGIEETSLLRFVTGQTSLRLDKADVLARYLGLHLVEDRDAEPLRPTPENLARPMLSTKKQQKKD